MQRASLVPFRVAPIAPGSSPLSFSKCQLRPFKLRAPPQENRNRLSPRTQGFHQPAEIKIGISVSRHVQTAAGDDVSAFSLCTASPECRMSGGGGGWEKAARYRALRWRKGSPEARFSAHPTPAKALSTQQPSLNKQLCAHIPISVFRCKYLL